MILQLRSPPGKNLYMVPIRGRLFGPGISEAGRTEAASAVTSVIEWRTKVFRKVARKSFKKYVILIRNIQALVYISHFVWYIRNYKLLFKFNPVTTSVFQINQ